MTGDLRFMLITAVPEVARHAEAAGIDRIFIDTEVAGKAERQGHVDTHKAAHSLADVPAVAAGLDAAELMVRLNPPSAHSATEVDQAIAGGAQRLMLPWFHSADEVQAFLSAVDGRVPVTLLVETPAALSRLPVLLPLLGQDDEIYFGLNDLRLGMGLDFLFEPLAAGLLDEPARQCRAAGVAFGFGGVGRVGQGALPSDWIMGEHVRLGSRWVVLSRAFHGGAECLADIKAQLDLADEVSALQAVEEHFRGAGADELAANRERLIERTYALAGQTEKDS